MWLGKWLSFGVLVGVLAGCAAPPPPRACTPGEMRGCTCNDGRNGAQRCDDLGERFDACYCPVCTPDCNGLACGPPRNAAACPGVACGDCGAGFSCAAGQCMRQTSPCAGRMCGLGSDGVTSCGDCGAGFSCSSGQCVRAPTCSRRVGDFCSASAECCPDGAVPTSCQFVWGFGRICTAQCTSNAGCGSACCARFEDNTMACASSRFCAAETGCTRAVNQSCTIDAECCRDPNARSVPTACGCIGSECICRAMCRANSDCMSGCCAPRSSDGLRVCAAATACR